MPKSTKKRGKRSKTPGVPFGAKARFIREQPTDEPASVVIARAKEAGISLSENHVYATRQKMKFQTSESASEPSVLRKTPSAKLRGNGPPSSVDKKKLIETLESSIFRLGWDEAKKVFERMEREHYVN